MQADFNALGSPLVILWSVVFASTYAAMTGSVGRFRPFHTSLIMKDGKKRSGFLRFIVAILLLNAAPLTIGVWLALMAGRWPNPTGWTMLFLLLTCNTPFIFSRLFMEIARTNWIYDHDSESNEDVRRAAERQLLLPMDDSYFSPS